MTDRVYVELTGRFDFQAMVAAMTSLGTHFGAGEPWDTISARDFSPGRGGVTKTLTAPGGTLVIGCRTDEMDPREGSFLAWDFTLGVGTCAARWDGAEWANRAVIALTLQDLGDFEGCRGVLAAVYGRDGLVQDTTERPEHAAHNAHVFAAHGHEPAALALAQRVLATEPEPHEGAARSALEGLRLRLGGVGPAGVWLCSTLARDPGNLLAWGLKGGPEAEAAVRLLTPFDPAELQAGQEPVAELGAAGRPVCRRGRPISFEAPRALRDHLFRDAGASAWDVREHARRGGPEGMEQVDARWSAPPEPGRWVALHRALWFGAGLRGWVQVVTNHGGRLRRVDWLVDQEFERSAVFAQELHPPNEPGQAPDNRQATVVLRPNAERWRSALEAADLEVD